MAKGKFIVIEGIEGAGKSTAISLVENLLTAEKIDFIQTREPGGTPLAEALRELVKSSEHQEKLTQQTELFLMYASRSQLLENKIYPAINNGLWVVGDRHDLSSRAYQGGGRQFDDNILSSIAHITFGDFKPDLTLYLDIAPEIGLARAKARGQLDRIELEKIEFFQRVREKYCQIAESDSSIKIIDAAQPIEQVHQDIKEHLAQFITDLSSE